MQKQTAPDPDLRSRDSPFIGVMSEFFFTVFSQFALYRLNYKDLKQYSFLTHKTLKSSLRHLESRTKPHSREGSLRSRIIGELSSCLVIPNRKLKIK